MVVSLKQHRAAEKKTVDVCMTQFQEVFLEAERDMRKIGQFVDLKPQSRILEIGSAQGLYIRACRQLGYQAEGLEPDYDAILTSSALDRALGGETTITQGWAEAIPHEAETFDLVLASSVLEHVCDINRVFSEVARVLKPGGAFFFSSASSLCPMQDEIRFFPFFGWYPDSLKRSVMTWAKDNAPSLIGYTDAPAINWFSPEKTKKLGFGHGFSDVYDQWDLKYSPDLSTSKGMLLKLIRSLSAFRLMADLFTPGCAYLLVKR